VLSSNSTVRNHGNRSTGRWTATTHNLDPVNRRARNRTEAVEVLLDNYQRATDRQSQHGAGKAVRADPATADSDPLGVDDREHAISMYGLRICHGCRHLATRVV